MKVLHEKVVAVRGAWAIKVRHVEYFTREQGRFNRPELVLEKQPGVADDVGFSLEDLAYLHKLLADYAQQNLYKQP